MIAYSDVAINQNAQAIKLILLPCLLVRVSYVPHIGSNFEENFGPTENGCAVINECPKIALE